jgi:single-strand DNA-binding protein
MSINNLFLIGNLVEAPEVVVTTAGTARARFRVASTERRRDPVTETWQDGESVFVQVTCWRRLAENVGNSLDKGDRVIVSGRLRQWVAEKDGVRRTVHEIEADAVGPDLQRGIVSVARTRRAPSADAPAQSEPTDADRPEDPDDSGDVGDGHPEQELRPGDGSAWSPAMAEATV